MNNEERLAKEMAVYRELAAQDKKIDVATLAINALQKHEQNLIPVSQKRWAYIISLAVPPVGLAYALKFYYSDKDDGRAASIMCLVLTIISVVMFLLLSKLMLSTGAGTLKPSDVQDLVQ